MLTLNNSIIMSVSVAEVVERFNVESLIRPAHNNVIFVAIAIFNFFNFLTFDCLYLFVFLC